VIEPPAFSSLTTGIPKETTVSQVRPTEDVFSELIEMKTADQSKGVIDSRIDA
jgi:hypothetical protein